MASLQKKYTNEKLKGQIFTPFFIVDKILDDIRYSDESILGKSIVDPACGDGRFLVKIVERIIKFSSKKDLEKNLSFVEGWDIDEAALEDAKQELNKLVEPSGIKPRWKLLKINSLELKPNKKFNFIVGNPPYIRIQHLEEKQRTFIQHNFEFCKSGSTDIFIAFYELALSLLKPSGICGFITPNTFFHTETAKFLRKHFVENKNIVQLTNYGHIQLFDNATTYSAITIFNLKKNNNFNYQTAISEQKFTETKIDIQNLTNTKFWQLSSNNQQITKGARLGDITNIHVGVTTLADKAYIFEIEKEDKNYIWCNTKLEGSVKFEKEILKPIIKVSTLKNGEEPIKEYILFPYKKIDGKPQIIPENELKTNFPLAYKYLLSVKEILDNRDNGKSNNVAWYAYGRSQGLSTSFGEKILFSPMNKEPKFIFSKNKEATFYSGYCIKYDGNIENLLKQLNSERMKEFISISSRDFRGGWKAYNKKIVQEFLIEKDNL
ncbi:MAG: Eco57I restriction-modification methylase domain-containing protein [Bacteroidales bacterium]|nr:Eco57I restriction-modification methylase domain-containing protein [Bacteroidales bacterium]